MLEPFIVLNEKNIQSRKGRPSSAKGEKEEGTWEE